MKLSKLLLTICLLPFTTNLRINCKDFINKKNGFILITVLYNETIHARIKEYIACLEKNIDHPLISHIHIIYDTSSDHLSQEHLLFKYLQEKPNISITYVEQQPSYGFCFAMVNKLYPGKKIILANADIYFNDTLYFLENYNFTNLFIILTRWNVRKDGSLFLYNSRFSQDAWIFETPLYNLEKSNIKIGLSGCDNQIAASALQMKLKIINPCLSIVACHLHNSAIRNYYSKEKYKVPKGYAPPPFSRLTKFIN